ncbi:hypothetical protein [Paludibacterium yongneupense]|uniref:hypothetical protein n=1 Tax=Paludibacterium yongneupense TaxID=400061 RepID=UPI0012EC1FF1|nr:hypothetical protein [Paludibacterium yongneupense]
MDGYQKLTLPKQSAPRELHLLIDKFTDSFMCDVFDKKFSHEWFLATSPENLATEAFKTRSQDLQDEVLYSEIFDLDDFFEHLALNIEFFQDKYLIEPATFEELANHQPRIGSLAKVIELQKNGEFTEHFESATKIAKNFAMCIEADCLSDMQGAFYAITNSYWIRAQGDEFILAARKVLNDAFDGVNGFSK